MKSASVNGARARGQAMLEYLVVSAALVFALFVLVSPDIGLPVVSYFLERLAEAMQRFLYAISTAT